MRLGFGLVTFAERPWLRPPRRHCDQELRLEVEGGDEEVGVGHPRDEAVVGEERVGEGEENGAGGGATPAPCGSETVGLA